MPDTIDNIIVPEGTPTNSMNSMNSMNSKNSIYRAGRRAFIPDIIDNII